MFKRSSDTVRYILVIALLVLLCEFVACHESNQAPLLISTYHKSSESAFINNLPQNISLLLNAELRTKKTASIIQENEGSLRHTIPQTWDKSLNTRSWDDLFFTNSVLPAFLWLDQPPPAMLI